MSNLKRAYLDGHSVLDPKLKAILARLGSGQILAGTCHPHVQSAVRQCLMTAPKSQRSLKLQLSATFWYSFSFLGSIAQRAAAGEPREPSDLRERAKREPRESQETAKSFDAFVLQHQGQAITARMHLGEGSS